MGGTGILNSSGIYITGNPSQTFDPPKKVIRRNKIYGASLSAIHINIGNTHLLNNLIHGGDSYAGHKTGIKIEQGSDSQILHNIIYSENLNTSGTTSLLDMDSAGAVSNIINSLFISGQSGLGQPGIPALIGNFHFATGTKPADLFLNNFIITTKPRISDPFRFEAGSPLEEYGYTDLDEFMNYGTIGTTTFSLTADNDKKNTYVDTGNNATTYFKKFTPLSDTSSYQTFFDDDWNWGVLDSLPKDPSSYGAWLDGIITLESYEDYNVTYTRPAAVGAYAGE